MLKTENKIIFTNEIQPINLAKNVDLNNSDLMLPGWGTLRTTMFIPDLPSKLQELKVTYVPFEKCNEQIEQLLEKNEENPLNKDVNICTGPLGGGKAACNGDSGGPLVLRTVKSAKNNSINLTHSDDKLNIDNVGDKNRDNDSAKEYKKHGKEKKTKENNDFIPIVVGIVSWGISPCGEKGAPTVYTNVSRYMDFVNKYINE
ncbi:unnamed protein product [Diatraea saccharalis]|uniref:Peptidase S1 domain-containing protein n=1 Tax=Diatraea saccharalis TaxID=40085 RepID=A0A9N9W9J0_9NEOP|nr:unnamed protein product [Diatraea saccharalis]